MLKECGTVLLYKQQKTADPLACEQMFNLPPGIRRSHLPAGQARDAFHYLMVAILVACVGFPAYLLYVRQPPWSFLGRGRSSAGGLGSSRQAALAGSQGVRERLPRKAFRPFSTYRP